MEILSGYDILVKKKKAKSDTGSWMNLMLPIQFISDSQKNLQWASMTMNFLESQGMLQLRRNLNWMSRNYQLANNEIDKRDYIKDLDNEYTDLLNRLTDENSATELRSVPFTQLIINSLVNEFTKRPSKISFNMLDDKSMDEMFQEKGDKIEHTLMAQCAIKQQNKMMELGLAPDSEEGKQMVAPETIKSLPEIQNFYTMNYRSMYQEWAEHQMKIDDERFMMDEQKRMCFKDSLVADRAFWEIMMKEQDYEVRRWNPKQVFYRKSPNERWIQNGQWVGYLTLMTVPDVLDMYGWMMSEEQQIALNRFYPAKSAAYAEDGQRPENFWDPTMSYEFNRTGPGIGMRQVTSVLGLNADGTGDIVNQLFADSEDIIDTQYTQLVRVSTIYWKTQRHVYELSRVDADGKFTSDLVSDSYVVTDKPVYNTLVYKEKTKENLVFGEHLDGIWVNETWGGIKVGPNLPVYGWTGDGNNFSPMYLGIRGGKPSKLPFQFQGENDKWNSLLPVCGSIFNDNNTHSRSVVDALKVYQIGVNMTMMQILDLMIDELGVILTFDPNALPTHSMGEDWGVDPFPKAVQVMKDFSMLPVKSSLRETGEGVNPQHLKMLDLSQSQRFLTKMKLHQFFKTEGLAAVGMNEQRLGQPLDREESTGTSEMNMSASFSTTEHLFTQFDELLVRFHKMRTDTAQFYNSTNPSVRLQYSTSSGMKQWFMMDGRQLDGRDIGVTATNSPHSRHVLDEIKKMVFKNNTTDTAMSDLIGLQMAESIADIERTAKGIEMKTREQIRQKQQQEQELQQQQQQHEQQMQKQMLDNENEQKRLDRENKLEVAQVMIAPKTADAGAIEDTTGKLMHEQTMHNDKMNLEKEKEMNKSIIEKQKLDLGKQKLAAENMRTQQQAQTAKLAVHTKAKNDKSNKK